MKMLVTKLGSTKLTLWGFLLLAISLVAKEFSIAPAQWLMFAMLGVLTINLACALLVTPRLRQEPGLLIFHLALLALLILAGVGRLTHFDGHVEVMEGNTFSFTDVSVDSRGALHPAWLEDVVFTQGPFAVDYAPGVKRARTRSAISFSTDAGTSIDDIGDDVPFISRGFRFYTTHNKGLAAVLTWQPERGEAITGAVHMPAYPLFDWKQDNHWQPPGGPAIRFWLHLANPLQEDLAWTLTSERLAGTLAVNVAGKRIELERGESVRVPGGELRFDELRGWMGYRIFFDPTLPWLFVAAMAALVGLALQFWRRPISSERNELGAPPFAEVPR